MDINKYNKLSRGMDGWNGIIILYLCVYKYKFRRKSQQDLIPTESNLSEGLRKVICPKKVQAFMQTGNCI